MAEPTELTSDLSATVKHHQTLWRANFAAAAMLFLAALISSALATVFAATGTHKALLPWLTATPGAMLLGNSYFKFSERYTWHFDKSTRVAAILRQLKYGKVPEKESVDWWNKVESEVNEKAPSFGEFSVYPGSGKPKS